MTSQIQESAHEREGQKRKVWALSGTLLTVNPGLSKDKGLSLTLQLPGVSGVPQIYGWLINGGTPSTSRRKTHEDDNGISFQRLDLQRLTLEIQEFVIFGQKVKDL